MRSIWLLTESCFRAGRAGGNKKVTVVESVEVNVRVLGVEGCRCVFHIIILIAWGCELLFEHNKSGSKLFSCMFLSDYIIVHA